MFVIEILLKTINTQIGKDVYSSWSILVPLRRGSEIEYWLKIIIQISQNSSKKFLPLFKSTFLNLIIHSFSRCLLSIYCGIGGHRTVS